MHLRRQVSAIATGSSAAEPRRWPEACKGKERLGVVDRGPLADQPRAMPAVHELRSVTPHLELDARPSSRIRGLLKGRRKEGVAGGLWAG